MGDPVDDRFGDLIRSEAAADWQARLTAVFFDAEARRRVIDEIRAAIADRVHAEDAAKLESLRQRVVGHLVGLASRDATPPGRGSADRPSPIAGAEVEDRVVTSYPYPIATPYRALTDEVSAAGAFGCLLDTFEGLIHFLAAVAVSAYLRGGLANPECNRQLLGRLVKEAWATGDLMGLLRDTLRLAGDCEGRLPLSRAARPPVRRAGPAHQFAPRARVVRQPAQPGLGPRGRPRRGLLREHPRPLADHGWRPPGGAGATHRGLWEHLAGLAGNQAERRRLLILALQVAEGGDEARRVRGALAGLEEPETRPRSDA